MYTSEQEQRLYNQGKDLLKTPKKDVSEVKNPEDILGRLTEVINYSDWKYYVQSDPVFSDSEYDALYKMLKELAEKYPEHVSADSPTQRIAHGLSE